MTKDEKSQILDRLMRLIWESLESHLEWTHESSEEGQAFHRKCVKDYSEMIRLVSDLY